MSTILIKEHEIRFEERALVLSGPQRKSAKSDHPVYISLIYYIPFLLSLAHIFITESSSGFLKFKFTRSQAKYVVVRPRNEW
jgi:hypothetical protein